MDQHTSRPRAEPPTAFMLQGGRIFMVLAVGGGLLTCQGAISTVNVRRSTSFGSGVLLRPITESNPTLPLVAFSAGLAMVVLAVSFIVLRRIKRRALLAVALIVTAIGTAVAFTDLRIGDPASLVPVGLRGGLSVCGTETPGPCLYVFWSTEKIVWGGWIGAFWGALALIRLRSSLALSTRPGDKGGDGAPTIASHAQLDAKVSQPTADLGGSALSSEPSPRRRVLTDARLLGWLVGATATVAVLFLVGLFIVVMVKGIHGP